LYRIVDQDGLVLGRAALVLLRSLPGVNLGLEIWMTLPTFVRTETSNSAHATEPIRLL
jgi:hypothetical protein